VALQTRNQIYTPTLGSIFMLGDVLLVLNATLINISLNGQFYGGESGEKHRFPNFTIPFSCNVVASIYYLATTGNRTYNCSGASRHDRK
jgi:hypothetical protein